MTQVRGRAAEQLLAAGQPLTSWTASQAASLTSSVVQTSHQLTGMDLFQDEGLADTLDRLPRQQLQIFTMGTDPDRSGDWTPVDAGDRSGADVLAGVREGRLFVNARLVDRADPGYEALRDTLFGELGRFRRDLVAGSPSLTLLITSPQALVYYHLDSGPNMLWHVRGEKRVFVYPAQNDFFVERADLEDVFAGVRSEFLPYQPEFDDAALSFDLRPGDLISWPQNAPHRITNHDSVNVSLSGEFDTRASLRRTLVYQANRFFSRRLHVGARSVQETGFASGMKRLSYRALRKARFDRTTPTHEYITTLRLDPASAGGVATLPEPVRTSFSVG